MAPGHNDQFIELSTLTQVQDGKFRDPRILVQVPFAGTILWVLIRGRAAGWRLDNVFFGREWRIAGKFLEVVPNNLQPDATLATHLMPRHFQGPTVIVSSTLRTFSLEHKLMIDTNPRKVKT
jgi:hypothetical protein